MIFHSFLYVYQRVSTFIGHLPAMFFLTNGCCSVPAMRFNYYRYVPARRLLCQEHQAYLDARLSHSMVNLPLMDDDYCDWPMLGDAKNSAILRCWSIFIHVLSHYIYIYIYIYISIYIYIYLSLSLSCLFPLLGGTAPLKKQIYDHNYEGYILTCLGYNNLITYNHKKKNS